MNLSFSVGWSRRQSISVWQCEALQSVKRKGVGFCVKSPNRWRAQGGTKAARLGRRRRPCSHPCISFTVLWLVVSEGVRALPGAALASRLLQHSLQGAGGVAVFGTFLSLILSPQNLTVCNLSPVSCSFTSPGLDLLSSAASCWMCCRMKEKGSWLLNA